MDDNTNTGGTYDFSSLQDFNLERPYSFISSISAVRVSARVAHP
jgi:hypothetical protein